MRMSELIEQHRDIHRKDRRRLVEALVKTGPIIHGASIYTATVSRRGRTTFKQRNGKNARGARDSATVEVPPGSFPEGPLPSGHRSMSQCLVDQFEGYARVLKSGIATAEDREDMESLAYNLDDLADELRRHVGLPRCPAGS